MRCKPGDIAVILKSVTGKNVGKYVTIYQYIGYIVMGDSFDYNGIRCQVPITDHYWWIDSQTSLDTPTGETSRAYGPDTWMKPIPPDILDDTEETGDDVYNTIGAEVL